MSALVKVNKLSLAQMNDLKISAISVPLDETVDTIPCPVCGKDKSFRVTRKDNCLLYICHRASCGVQGMVGSSIDGTSSVPVNRLANGEYPGKFKPNPFRGIQSTIPDHILQWLNNEYELDEDTVASVGWTYEKATHRLLMPIMSWFGHRVGISAKKLPLSRWGGEKVVKYREMDEPFGLYFPHNRWRGNMEKEFLVIVEDIMSCEKVNMISPAVALQGTNMNIKQAHVLASHYPNAIIMLDPDAMAKAATIHSKYSGVFKKLRIASLTKDPKEMKKDMLRKIIISIRGDY